MLVPTAFDIPTGHCCFTSAETVAAAQLRRFLSVLLKDRRADVRSREIAMGVPSPLSTKYPTWSLTPIGVVVEVVVFAVLEILRSNVEDVKKTTHT